MLLFTSIDASTLNSISTLQTFLIVSLILPTIFIFFANFDNKKASLRTVSSLFFIGFITVSMLIASPKVIDQRKIITEQIKENIHIKYDVKDVFSLEQHDEYFTKSEISNVLNHNLSKAPTFLVQVDESNVVKWNLIVDGETREPTFVKILDSETLDPKTVLRDKQ